MAIPLSCPSCDHEFKVKDELAGRRVKCPKCKEAVAVLAKKDTAAARTAAKKSSKAVEEEDDDELEEEERPRKKKKKRKSKKGLIIATVIGAVVLIGIIGLVLVLGGGGKDKPVVAKKVQPAPEPPAPVVEQPAPRIPKKQPATAIARRMEATAAQNALRQLGLAYRNFEVEHGRGPKDQKELGPYYQNIAEINESLTNQWVTFIWGATRQSFNEHGSSNTILAYETDPDTQGNRYAVMGDGSVQIFDDGTFQKTPKAKGK